MSAKKTRLLVVDDEPGMRRTLSRIMKAKGMEVEVADCGASALQIAREFQPDVVLLDIRMPGMDGVETWQKIKPTCPDAFAVFMTAYATSERTEDALREGGLRVFSKPIDVDEVCGLIASAMRPVLIVDDDPGFRESLQRSLRKLSFYVATASTPTEAEEAFRRHPRAVILLDMKLDGASGLEALRQIRTIRDDAPIILMTGFSDMQTDMQSGVDQGAQCAFTKPFDIDELSAAILRHTESADAV